MPQADAMVLVARNYERYKNECREKEREEIARQAAKMADEAILQERERGGPEEGMRGGHPPAIQSLLNLLADRGSVAQLGLCVCTHRPGHGARWGGLCRQLRAETPILWPPDAKS